MTMEKQAVVTNLGGRKRDASRDKAILEATIDVVAEVGYIGLTMDAVAQRAGASKATLYRRWDSKVALIRDAMTKLKETPHLDKSVLDTGHLRDDLIALFVTESPQKANRRLRVMLGLISVLAYEEAAAELGDTVIVAPWAEACRWLITRAESRGEVTTEGVNLDMLSRIVPSMAVSRALLQRRSVDREFLTALVDGVLLPALKAPSGE